MSESSDLLLAPIADLDGVGLETLTSTAALLTRVDRKYVLTAAEASALLPSVDHATKALRIDGSIAMEYATMYFDTADLLSFRLAALGRRRRFKLRSRLYVESSAAFLEIKTKGARKTTVKERIEQPLSAVAELSDDGKEYAAAAVGALGYGRAIVDALEPTLETRYLRTTLLQPSGARATIDTQLTWADAWGARMEARDLVIIETKSASRASELDRVLWRHGHRPLGISKFATGLAAMRPELPNNRWRRVIRRHLTEERALHIRASNRTTRKRG